MKSNDNNFASIILQLYHALLLFNNCKDHLTNIILQYVENYEILNKINIFDSQNIIYNFTTNQKQNY